MERPSAARAAGEPGVGPAPRAARSRRREKPGPPLCAAAAAAIVPAVSLDDDVLAELRELAGAHRLRVPRIVDGVQGPLAVIDGREVINFASNDYLGLAGDPRLMRAAAAVLEDSG